MITLPFSLELGTDEDSRNVVMGNSTTPIDGKIKIFIGFQVNPKKRQSIVGVLRSLVAHIDKTNTYFWGNYEHGSAGSFKKGSTFGGSDDDVCIIIGTNVNRSSSRELHETVNQIINSLVEEIVDHSDIRKHEAISSAFINETGESSFGGNNHIVNLNERKSTSDMLFLWVAYQKVSSGQGVSWLRIDADDLTLRSTIKPESALGNSLYLDLWTLEKPKEGSSGLSINFEKYGHYYAIFGGVFSNIGEIASTVEQEQTSTERVIIENIRKHSGSIIFAGGVKDGLTGDVFIPETGNTENVTVSASGNLDSYGGPESYQILSILNGRALTVFGGNQDEGAEVQFRPNGTGLHQTWEIQGAGEDYQQLAAMHSGKSLTSMCANGLCPITQNDWINLDSQKFKFEPFESNFKIYSKQYPSLLLTAQPGSGAALELATNSENQLFKIRQTTATSFSAFFNTASVGFPSINIGSVSSSLGNATPNLSAIIATESRMLSPSAEPRRPGGGGFNWGTALKGLNSGSTVDSCYGLATDEQGIVIGVFDHGYAGRSTDNGNTWQGLPRGLSQSNVSADWWRLDTDKKGVWIAVGQNGIASRSEDNGLTWMALTDWLSTGGTNGTITSARYVGNSSWVACASSSYCSISVDNGKTWTGFGRGLDGVLPNNGGPIDFASDFGGVVIAACNNGYAARSEDFGVTWVQLVRGLGSTNNNAHIYTICTNQYGLWFAGMAEGHNSLSTDNGLTWSAGPKGLNTSSTTEHIVACASDGRSNLVVGFDSGFASYSDDYGRTWTELSPLLNSGSLSGSITRMTTDRNGMFIVGETGSFMAVSPPQNSVAKRDHPEPADCPCAFSKPNI